MGGARMSLFDVNPDPEEAFLYNTIASICSDYLYVWDLEGDVLLASPNMVSDLGLDGNRLANCSQMDIKWVHPHDRERVQKQYAGFLSDWRTDLGGSKNFHNGAGGTYDCIAIMSYYTVCRVAAGYRRNR